VGKQDQTRSVEASTPELTIPEQVSVALAEIAESATEGLPVAAYQLFWGTEVLGRLALERMLGGLSTRRYPLGLEPVGSLSCQAGGSGREDPTPEIGPPDRGPNGMSLGAPVATWQLVRRIRV
jgi:hypothetical protein